MGGAVVLVFLALLALSTPAERDAPTRPPVTAPRPLPPTFQPSGPPLLPPDAVVAVVPIAAGGRALLEHVRPGSHVDVIHLDTSTPHTTARTLLRAVTVLHVDPSGMQPLVGPPADDGAPTLTLQLDAREAKRLAAARGGFQPTLRNDLDVRVGVDIDQVDIRDLRPGPCHYGSCFVRERPKATAAR